MCRTCLPLSMLVLWLLLPQPQAQGRLCDTLELTDIDYGTHLSASRLRRGLAEVVNGCQYVRGDLIISWMGVDRISGRRLAGDIRDMPTDFLDSVVEIAGRLVVKMANLRRLELRNLRVIRGQGTGPDAAAIELGLCAHPMQLVLPRLAAIVKGDVRLLSATDRSLYCHVTRTVAWSGLFQSPGQRVNSANVTGCTVDSRFVPSCDCAGVAACHSACADGGCWAGADAAACQTRSGRCRRQSCGACYADPSSGQEACCHSACLGGCSGPSARECLACRSVSYHNGECLDDCPMNDAGEPMVRAGSICMRSCPHPLLLDSGRRNCVAECPSGQLPVGGSCTACGQQSCRFCESNERLLDDKLAQAFSKCSVWRLGNSFNVDGSTTSDIAWQSLASARIVYSSSLNIKRTQARAPNLSILRRLAHVSGNLVIMDLTATHLGLSGLRSAKSLVIFNVRGLCEAWFPSAHLDSGKLGFPVIRRKLTFASGSSGECAGAVCHRQCRGGCWGPGPELCVA